MKLNDNQKGVLAMVVMVVAAIVALLAVYASNLRRPRMISKLHRPYIKAVEAEVYPAAGQYLFAAQAIFEGRPTPIANTPPPFTPPDDLK